MKFTMPNKNYGIVELYDAVAKLMGKANDNLSYDCRYINVAENIQDGFFAHYREENPNLTDKELKDAMIGLLLCYGPKVDVQLAENEVEVFDGFIC